MRKINGKLFLALLVGAAVLTGGVFVVHHFQYQRIARALLFQARRADDKGEKREEAKYLQRYLEFNPRDQDETANLARLWASDAFGPNSKQRRQSVGLMDQVLAYKDDPDLRRLLVKTALEMRPADVARAREHLERLLPREELNRFIVADKALREKKEPLNFEMARPDAARGELEGYWGLILEDGKDTVAALHSHRLAILHAPETQVSYLRLAYLLRRENESDPQKKRANQAEADRVVDALVAKNPEAHESYLTRWRYRRDFNLLRLRDSDPGRIELEPAAEDVAAAIKRKPESVEVLLAAADLERLRGRATAEDASRAAADRRSAMKDHRDRAAEHLKRGMEIVARNPAATTEYGRFQLLWHQANMLLDDLDVARAQAEDEGAPVPDMPKLKDEVAGVVEQIRRSQIPAAADYVRGRLLVHEKKWPEAAKLFENARALLDEQPEMACQANLYLGQCYERLEEHAQMYAAYQAVLKRDPNSLQAQLGMAQALWLQGQLADAKKQYAAVMRRTRVPARGWLDMARLEMQMQLQKDAPNWEAVEHALRNAEKLMGPRASIDVALLRYEVLVRKGEVEEARRLLDAECLRDPKEPEVHAALVDLALREKKTARAKAALDRGKREAGDRAAVRLAEARLLATTEGKKANAAIAGLADKAEKMPEEERARLLAGVAEVLTRNEDVVSARKTWHSLAALPNQKNNLRLRLLLFDLAMRDADEDGMRAVLDEVRRVEQESGSYHRYGQALYSLWKARRTKSPAERDDYLRQASAQLDQVHRQRSAWAPVNVALAEIAELKGQPELAIKNLREAMSNGDNSPATVRRLVMLLARKKDDREARQLLATLKESMLRQAALWQINARIETGRGNHDKAIEIARNALPADNKEPRDMVLLAGLLVEAWRKDRDEKKLNEAADLLDKAIELSADDAVPYVAKVQFLVDQKRKDDALQVLAALEKNVEKGRAVALGRCHDLVGNPKKAVAYYAAAVKADPEDAETVKTVATAHLAAGRGPLAEELLRKMAGGKMSRLSGPDVVEAQRSLALLLAAGTDFRRFSEALELVGLKLDGQGRLEPPGEREEQNETQRTRAKVLATQNQKQFRAEAIKLFEKLRRKDALTPDDRFILARLYEIEGDPDKSRENLAELVKAQAPTPQYLAHYAHLLIMQKHQLEEAEKKIVLLEELEKQREVGPNGFGSVDLRTKLLERQGKPKDALKLIRAHAGRRGAKPEEVLLVIGTLSRQNLFQEAYDLCEATWKQGKCQPEAIGAVSVALLQVWKDASDAQIRRVEKRVEEALEKNDKSVVLRLHLAHMHDKRGQYDRAADEYRKVLKDQPNNVVALNNLAWMLATRSGDAEKALAHVEKAIAGMGRRADLLDTRAMVRLALKEPAKAVADLKEAVADGATPTRLYHLARAHHENREQDKAKAALEQAKAKGLEVASLHPVEHEEAKKLLAEYRLN